MFILLRVHYLMAKRDGRKKNHETSTILSMILRAQYYNIIVITFWFDSISSAQQFLMWLKCLKMDQFNFRCNFKEIKKSITLKENMWNECSWRRRHELKKENKKKTTPTSRERNEGWYDERAKWISNISQSMVKAETSKRCSNILNDFEMKKIQCKNKHSGTLLFQLGRSFWSIGLDQMNEDHFMDKIQTDSEFLPAVALNVIQYCVSIRIPSSILFFSFIWRCSEKSKQIEK